MKHSVIRIIRSKAGQNCKVELTVNDKIDADYFADIMNRNYGGKNVSWIVDSYKIAEIGRSFFMKKNRTLVLSCCFPCINSCLSFLVNKVVEFYQKTLFNKFKSIILVYCISKPNIFSSVKTIHS